MKNKEYKNTIYNAVIVVSLGVMAFSAYKMAVQTIQYKKAAHANEITQERYVQGTAPAIEPDEAKIEAFSVPSEEPASPPTVRAQTSTGNQEHPVDSADNAKQKKLELANPSPYTTIVDVDFDSMMELNNDAAGWLYGMDELVNYPVAQGADNVWYAHHLLDGRYMFCGTLMVDYRNNFLEDDITYIYGHKMKDKTMFGWMNKYDTYEYYKEHPTFTLSTPDVIYELQVVGCVYTTRDEPLIFNFDNEEHFYNTMESYRSRSKFQTSVEVEYGDRLVSLWCCAFHVENGMMFVLCKAVPIRITDQQ